MSSIPARDPALTKTGLALGTAAYMSPEQVRGEALDTRTDLFSFGLILYEMATGQQAFSGETAAILYEAIKSHQPIPARQLNPDLPPKLEEITKKALQKERELRYQTALQIRDDLVCLKGDSCSKRQTARGHRYSVKIRIGAAVLAAAILGVAGHSVRGYLRSDPKPPNARVLLAVLPFENLTGNAEQDYMTDGLTDSIISKLAQLNPARLAVIARSSVMRYKHAPLSIDTIGQELHVDYVLEGSVNDESGVKHMILHLISVRDQT